MKIGLISINMYPKGLNFACPLHTFAFQQFLLRNGIESTIIDYKPVYYGNFDLRHPSEFYEKVVDKRYRDKNMDGIEELIEKRDGYRALYREREIRYDKFKDFIDKNYLKTDKCYDSDLLEIEDPGFDCYICVTDVIWKKEPNKGFDRGFFLASKTMENKKKIAYAASRGVFFAENEQDEKQFFHYVNDIDRIGVREESLKEYIEGGTGRDIAMVLDPVMLNERSFYDELAIKPKEDNYLFVYYVMEKARDTLSQAVTYARAHNLKIVEMTDRPLPNGRLSDIEDVTVVYRYDVGVEEWLGYFKYADAVFTNSFHACCLSILFEKEFFVGSRNGDKVSNVLNQFGLSNRRFNKRTDLIGNPLPPIDYESVGRTLEEKRSESASWILGAINGLENTVREQKDYQSFKKGLTYPIAYNSRTKKSPVDITYDKEKGSIKHLPSGSVEFVPNELVKNDGQSHFLSNGFVRKDYNFKGWRLRIKIDNRWFWLLEDGNLELRDRSWNLRGRQSIFADCAEIPFLDVGNINYAVAEACWSVTLSKRIWTKIKKMIKR